MIPIRTVVDDHHPAVAVSRPALERLAIRCDGRIVLIDVSEVDWVEASGVYVVVHVGPRAFEYRSSLAQLSVLLAGARFLRIHRTALVNALKVRELRSRGHGDYVLVLKSGVELVLSRHYRLDFERWLQQPL